MTKVVAMVAMLVFATPAFANDKTRSDEMETEPRWQGWLPAFITTSAVFVGSWAVLGYSHVRVGSEAEQIDPQAWNRDHVTQDDCGSSIRGTDSHFDAACTWFERSRIASLTMMISAPFVIFTGYLAFRAQPKRERSRVTLVPTVTPETAGATLDIRW